MKIAATAIVCFALGLTVGTFIRPTGVHAQGSIRVEKVNMFTGRVSVGAGTPIGISCVPAGSQPDCYVLTQ